MIGHERSVGIRLGVVSNQRVEGRSAPGSGPLAELAPSHCADVSMEKQGDVRGPRLLQVVLAEPGIAESGQIIVREPILTLISLAILA